MFSSFTLLNSQSSVRFLHMFSIKSNCCVVLKAPFNSIQVAWSFLLPRFLLSLLLTSLPNHIPLYIISHPSQSVNLILLFLPTSPFSLLHHRWTRHYVIIGRWRCRCCLFQTPTSTHRRRRGHFQHGHGSLTHCHC